MMNISPLAYAKSHIPPPGHQRTYISAYAVGMLANGVFLPIYVLYLIQILGIPNAQAALAIAIAGLIGLPLTLVAGDLADRLGPRRVVLFGLAGQVVGMGCYVFIQGFWSLLAVVMSMNVFAYAYLASEGALLRRIGGQDTVTFRSQVQVLGSIAVTVGALVAGVGISIGTPWAYRVMFLAVAAAYLVVIAITLRIPDYEPLPKPESTGEQKAPRWIVFRDRPFIAYALISGCLTVSSFVEHMLLPIWIVVHTSAPRWTVAMAFVVSTGVSILLQMRLSRDIRSTRQAGTALLRSGVTLLAGYLILAAMQGRSPWLATVLVVVGVALVSVAQIWLISGRFVFEFNLPPAHAQGQYDGFLNTVMTLSVTAAPLVLIGLVADRGSAGWAGLGLLFLVLGMLGPSVAAWADRTRPAETTPTETTTGPAGTDTIVAKAGTDDNR
jgi:MFS family permease